MFNYRFQSRKRVRLDGVDERLETANNPTMSSNTKSGGRCISLWFNTASLPASETNRFVWVVNTLAQFGLWNIRMRTNRSGQYTGTRIEGQHANNLGSSNGLSSIWYTSTNLSINTNYHLVFQTTGSAFESWINNSSQTITFASSSDGTSGDWMGDKSFSTNQIRIGGSGSGFFDGFFDEICYFNKNLTSGEVALLYNSGVPIDPRTLGISGLAHYWKCGEGNEAGDGSTTLFDSVGSQDLTCINMEPGDVQNVQY